MLISLKLVLFLYKKRVDCFSFYADCGPTHNPVIVILFNYHLLTLDSGINVAPGINIAPGTFDKNIKRSP